MSKKNMRKSNYNSDISLLFAPQEEKHALEIASLLEQRGIRVYIYDLKSLKTKKTELLSFTTEYKARYHKKSDYFIYLLSRLNLRSFAILWSLHFQIFQDETEHP
jgi:hypothetical protein